MLNMIPFPYKILIAVLVICGIFGYGYMKGLQVGNDKLKLFKAQSIAQYQELQAAYEKAKNAVNEKIITEYVDRIVYVTKWRTKNVEIVKEVPSNCELSSGWVHVHDSAAESRDANSTAAADGTSSKIKDTEALATVVDNYGTCAANAERLTALQNWVKDQQIAVGKINRDNGVTPSESTSPPSDEGGSSGLIER
jgi:hypothetical protein